ncbi:CsbD family protein [Homoserinimonas sp. OAct 916]|uniref:CsbD family protein n=1 Tax=Homoserinimonas sp. OAct 916 TaxID=2211450 RepID=UPI000DBE609F|nr:CsbD family protein [Homoserinimonas sp. OAct 916]
MTTSNKAKNTAEDLKGKTKEAAGKVADNDKLVAEGKADQAKASVKKAAGNAKDAVTK